MNLKELREKLAALYREGKPLAERSKRGELTDDEAKRLEEIATEAEALREQIDAAEKRDRAAEGILAGDQHYNQPAGRRATAQAPIGANGDGRAAGQAGETRDEGRTLGERFVRSEAFEEYRARLVGLGGRSRPLEAGSFYHAHPAGETADATPDELRALITSTTVTTLIQPQRLPGIYEPDARPLRMRDLMVNLQTNSNSIEFVRMLSVTNNAAEVAEATSLSTGQKPESGFTLEIANTPVRTIAHLEYATRAALDDVPQLQGIIENQLLRGIDEREDRQLLMGDGSGANLLGIYNQSGIQNLNGAYWAANPLPAVGAAATKFDRLLRAITKVRLTGRAAASAIVMNPNQIEEARLLKVSSGAYAYPAGGPFGANIPTMWGLPIVESEDIPDNMAFVGAFNRYAVVFDRMQSQVYVTDSNRDLFERNIITILAESRLAVALIRPAAFVKVDLAATS